MTTDDSNEARQKLIEEAYQKWAKTYDNWAEAYYNYVKARQEYEEARQKYEEVKQKWIEASRKREVALQYVAVRLILTIIGIAALNLAMIPVLALYLTIYGFILSLSGGGARIMLKHYDAFGKRMVAPIKEYLYYEAIAVLIVILVALYIGSLILLAFQTGATITANNAAQAAAGYNLTTNAAILTYFPVFAIVIFIVILLYLIRYFIAGAGAFAI